MKKYVKLLDTPSAKKMSRFIKADKRHINVDDISSFFIDDYGRNPSIHFHMKNGDHFYTEHKVGYYNEVNVYDIEREILKIQNE